MSNLAFENGLLKIDTAKTRDEAVYLAFNRANADHKKYEVLEKSLPRMHGLRRKSHRQSYAYDVILALETFGYEIKKKDEKDSYIICDSPEGVVG